MDKLEILAKVEEYYEREFNSLILVINSTYFDRYRAISRKKYALDRLHGFCAISMFVQDLGVDFESVNSIYEKYYKKIHDLILTF